MFKIGCHLSISKGLLAAAKQIVSIGGNTFQYFSRNPQGFKAKEFNQKDFEAYLSYAKEHNLYRPLVHAPYTLNCCSSKEEVRELAQMILKDDIKRLEVFDDAFYNIHPGAHTGQGAEQGIQLIAKCLNEIVTKEQKTTILLELMSGKGSDIGRSFEEIKQILDLLNYKEKFGVCLDTCHIFSAGYDIVNNLDYVLKQFDDIIGLDKLMAIHLNDSLMPFDSHKDRHAKIGEGLIGLEALTKIINHPLLKDLPFYLETPQENIDGYQKEIELLKKLYKY